MALSDYAGTVTDISGPATSLGLGGLGGPLAGQGQDETDEERKRRLKALQDRMQLGPGSIFGRQQTSANSIFGSTSPLSGLFGSYGR